MFLKIGRKDECTIAWKLGYENKSIEISTNSKNAIMIIRNKN